MSEDLLVHNGALVGASTLSLPELARGIYYGEGCFETFRAYKARFLCIAEHLERLAEATRYIGIEIDIPNVSSMQQQIEELLLAKRLADRDAVIRIQVYRSGGRGFSIGQAKGCYIIEAGEIVSDKTAYSLLTSPIRSIPEVALSRKFKLSNSLNYIKAAAEASEKGRDSALMLTVNGKVSETELANIFWCKNGSIYTPSEQCDILPGITRHICIQLADKMGHMVEGEFDPVELMNADAVWLTNSLKEIIPVSAIDDHEFDVDHPMILRVKEQFEMFKSQNLL